MRNVFPHKDLRLETHSVQPESANRQMSCGFLPAFQDQQTGETHLSLTSHGTIAPVHLLEGLPGKWIAERDLRGRVSSLKSGIVAGFMRDGRFYTRQELAARPLDA
jgi:hypothetical protein